jgi:hypothetical protein
MKNRGSAVAAAVFLGCAGCTANRAVNVAIDPESVSRYLASSRPADIQVADSAGAKVWLHGPRVTGDSLVGTLSRDEPRKRRAVALTSITSLAVPRFSAGKTFALIGGVVGSAGIGLIIIASGSGSEPVY